MATEYWYVKSPTDDDLTNSVQGVNSPFTKSNGVETYLLTFTNGYQPSNGYLEYHVDKQQAFDGKKTDDSNKVPDPFALTDLKLRGEETVEAFWSDNPMLPVARVKVHVLIDTGLHLLELGDFAAARAYINSVSTTTEFTSAAKTGLLSDIDAVLDDYEHLKDSGVYTP